MSYARFGPDSDVYVYSDGEAVHCCGCYIVNDDFRSSVFGEIMAHLEEHVGYGHKVPAYCIDRLRSEAAAGKWQSQPDKQEDS